jgi:hypothetical protein
MRKTIIGLIVSALCVTPSVVYAACACVTKVVNDCCSNAGGSCSWTKYSVKPDTCGEKATGASSCIALVGAYGTVRIPYSMTPYSNGTCDGNASCFNSTNACKVPNPPIGDPWGSKKCSGGTPGTTWNFPDGYTALTTDGPPCP